MKNENMKTFALVKSARDTATPLHGGGKIVEVELPRNGWEQGSVVEDVPGREGRPYLVYGFFGTHEAAAAFKNR